jgi:hypothetical protein
MANPKPNYAEPAEAEKPDYPPLIPNAVTIAAMEEPDELAVTYTSLAAMMAELHADD